MGAVLFVLIFALGAIVSVPGSDDEPATATSAPVVSPAAPTTAPPTPTATSAPATTDDVLQTTVPPSTDEPVSETIGELVRSDPQFSQLASLIGDAGLADVVDGTDPLTMLAPTDDAFDAAFDALGADAFEALLSDPDRVGALVLHHLRTGAVPLDEFESGPVEMLDGTDVVVDRRGDEVTFESDGVVARPLGPDLVDLAATNGVLHAIDQVLPVPGDVTDPVEPEDDAPVAVAVLEDGRIVLSGFVATDADRARLASAAEVGRHPANVVDDLVVDPGAALVGSDVERLARIVEVMPALLVSGTAALSPDSLVLTGVHLGDGQARLAVAFGEEVGAAVEVEPRPVADDMTAALLTEELARFVASNPIRFESNSGDLTPGTAPVIEQVAARVQRLDGVRISIVGHTDSGGEEIGNLVLSEARAAAVLEALVAVGVAAEILESSGRGSSEPILDASGAEDLEASRRVEFLASLAT